MEVAVPHQVIHGIAEFARGGLPTPAATDDGNVWVDGFCWLYCGQQWTRVLWLGPVKVAGAQASMYACGPCIRALQEQVWQAILLGHCHQSGVSLLVSGGRSGSRGASAGHPIWALCQ